MSCSLILVVVRQVLRVRRVLLVLAGVPQDRQARQVHLELLVHRVQVRLVHQEQLVPRARLARQELGPRVLPVQLVLPAQPVPRDQLGHQEQQVLQGQQAQSARQVPLGLLVLPVPAELPARVEQLAHPELPDQLAKQVQQDHRVLQGLKELQDLQDQLVRPVQLAHAQPSLHSTVKRRMYRQRLQSHSVGSRFLSANL